MKKLKKTTYIMIICAMALLFSSCQNEMKNVSTEIELEDGSGTGILANNDAVDFYFYYPANWTLHRNDLMIIVYINDQEVLQTDRTEPSSGEYLSFMTKPNISASVFSLLEGYETIDDYWNDFATPSLEGVFQDLNVESVEELTVADIPAKKYTYTMSSIGMNYKISQIVFFKNRQVYALTYTATGSKYDTYAGALNTAAETFEFK